MFECFITNNSKNGWLSNEWWLINGKWLSFIRSGNQWFYALRNSRGDWQPCWSAMACLFLSRHLQQRIQPISGCDSKVFFFKVSPSQSQWTIPDFDGQVMLRLGGFSTNLGPVKGSQSSLCRYGLGAPLKWYFLEVLGPPVSDTPQIDAYCCFISYCCRLLPVWNNHCSNLFCQLFLWFKATTYSKTSCCQDNADYFTNHTAGCIPLNRSILTDKLVLFNGWYFILSCFVKRCFPFIAYEQ